MDVRRGLQLPLGQKVIAIAEGLNEHEREIQQERERSDERELRSAVNRAGNTGGVVGEDQRHHHQRRQRAQRRRGARPGKARFLLMLGSGDQTKSEQQVQDDHAGREDSVPGERHCTLAVGEHQ